MRVSNLFTSGIAVAVLAAIPGVALADTGTGGAATPAPGTTTGPTGGVGVTPPPAAPSTPSAPIVPGYAAKIIAGVAYAPSLAPIQVQRAIWAGNRIRLKPYIFGGGHQSFRSRGYDCSGSVSYILHAAGLIKHPMDSSSFMGWGTHGVGQWITVYTNPGHAFIDIAGIRLDTSAEADPHPAPGSGPRWRPLFMDAPGFMARHPLGY